MIRRTRWLAVPVIASFAVLGLTPTVAHAAPAPDQIYSAAGDAYVKEAAPTTAEGTADPTNCSVNDDSGNRMHCLLKFTVDGLVDGDTVTGAEIRVVDKGNAAGSKLVNLNVTPAFNESTVTWNNAGAVGAFVSSQSSHVFGQDSVWSVDPDFIFGNSDLYFVLSSPVNSYPVGMNFQPKENTVGKPAPRLVLHIDHQSGPVAALTVTPGGGGQAPFSVNADASASTDPDGDIGSYNFEWGDATQTGFQVSSTASHTYTTAGTYQITMTVVDSGGRPDVAESAIFEVTAPPPPDRNDVVFGANVHQRTGETFTQALAREDSTSSYQPKALRLFYTGLPSTSCTSNINAAATGRTASVSFKADPTQLAAGNFDATINAWLSCFPTDRDSYVTYYHEMEDNFTTSAQKTAWITGWQHFSNLVTAHSNHAHLKRTIIYGDFTWLPSSGRNYLDWWPGDSFVDVLGADEYNFNENNGTTADDQTQAAHQAARPSYAAAVAHGVAFAVPELGYDDWDTRPGFLTDAGSWFRDPTRNIAFVTYFDGGNVDVEQPGNHQLIDQASIDAWRNVCAS